MSRANAATQARRAMQSLGVYKKEFEPVISILGELKKQYDALTKEFEKSGFRYYEETNAGTKKAPIVVTLEGLRRDILSYYSQLGLTPQGLLKLKDQALNDGKKGNSLVEALRELKE